jgi:hypothetical protein
LEARGRPRYQEREGQSVWGKNRKSQAGYTPDATKEKVNCIEGAKAYAPFGAGRETGHQVPAVAAKKEGKTINMEAELPLKPCEKKREKEREKQRREMGEK